MAKPYPIEASEPAHSDPAINIYDLLPPAFWRAWNDGVSGVFAEQWFPGGRWSGKSTYIARFLIGALSAKGNENAHAVVFRKHQTNLRNSVYNELKRAIRDLGVEYLWDAKLSPLSIVRRDTGQIIQFCGLDDVQKHKSEKPPFGYFKFAWFEETAEFDNWEEIEQTIISYCRADTEFLTLFSFNPPRSTTNWCNAQVAKRGLRKRVYRTDYRDLVDIGAVPDRILEMIGDMRRSNYEMYRHVFLGEATGTGGEIFTNVIDRRITDEEIAEFEDKRYGMDFGMTRDPTVLMGCHYDSDKNTLFVFDEEWMEHPFYVKIYEMLKRKGLDRADIVADTAPSGWIDNINALGANLRGCYKADDWREMSVSWLRSLYRIVIDSQRCPNAYREFSTWEYVTIGGRTSDKLPKMNDHAIDAVRYSLNDILISVLKKRPVILPVAIKRRFR